MNKATPYSVEKVMLNNIFIPKEIIYLVDPVMAVRCHFVPIRIEKDNIYLAVDQNSDVKSIPKAVRGLKVNLVMAINGLNSAVDKYFKNN
jgi:hypothetical protein